MTKGVEISAVWRAKVVGWRWFAGAGAVLLSGGTGKATGGDLESGGPGAELAERTDRSFPGLRRFPGQCRS